MAGQIKVDGVPQTVAAFNKVSNDIQDLSKAHQAEANMLLPAIKSATRKRSGDLAGAWQGDGIATEAKFINSVVYAGVQEYGWPSHNIEPTNAIIQAYERNSERTEAIYADAIGDIARRAGFDTE
jgi:hypothetical protein